MKDETLLLGSAAAIAAAIAKGSETAESVTAAYLERIDDLDRSGPELRSVLAVNPEAADQARALDAELRVTGPRGPLHGVPIVVKDNIETADPLATTAGSLALLDNVTNRDADAVAGLRAAGVVILGKANLSEWANFRSSWAVSGWSGVGGQVRNPHVLDRTPGGSSSGSGVATAAGLAAASIGTETNGSISCPAAMNGVVGFKPTVGLVSQGGIVPVSPSQDAVGPITRTVADAALMTEAMAFGPGANHRGTGLLLGLDPTGQDLAGRRLGALRWASSHNPAIEGAFDRAVEELRRAGCEVVDIVSAGGGSAIDGSAFGPDSRYGYRFGQATRTVVQYEFKAALDEYLAGAPSAVSTRSMADVIAFNAEPMPGHDLPLFGQDLLERAQARGPLTDSAYVEARELVRRITGPEGIDRLLAEYGVEVLVAPSAAPAPPLDLINGDALGRVGAGWMAACAGYPHLTVPMGTVRAVPVGLSFLGAAGADALVLAIGHGYEQATRHRPTPRYLESVAAFSPAAPALPCA